MRSRFSRSLEVGALAALLAAAPLTARAQGTVQGAPNSKYRAVADFADAEVLLRADPASLGSWASDSGKLVEVAAAKVPSGLALRLRFERPLAEYFAALSPNKVTTRTGLWVSLFLDTDGDDATALEYASPIEGADLIVTLSGKGLQKRFDVSGRCAYLDAAGARASQSLHVEEGNLTYGGDVVEVVLPEEALRRLGPRVEVAHRPDVRVGDRRAADLVAVWERGPAPEPAPAAESEPTAAERAAGEDAFATILDMVRAFETGQRPSGAEAEAAEARFEAAVATLKSLGSHAAQLLRPHLAGEDPLAARLSLRLATEIGDGAASLTPELIASSASADADTRAGAAQALSGTGRAEALARLRELLRDEDPQVRYWAAAGLGKFGAGAADAVPDLVAAIDDPEGRVVEAAVRSLGEVGSRPEIALPALEKALGIQTLAAIGALQRFGSAARPAVPALVERLRHHVERGDDWAATEAAVAIGAIGGPDALQALPHLEELHERLTAVNTKQDVADVIYALRAAASQSPGR